VTHDLRDSNDGKRAIYGDVDLAPASHFYSITHDILGDPFWAIYRRGLKDAAEQLECCVHHLAPEYFSPPLMASLIDEARVSGAAGILTTVPDISAVDLPIRRAIEDGIPVIAVNAADPRPVGERIPYFFYIGGSDFAAGQSVGRRLLAQGQSTAGLAVDHYLVDNACHSARCDGFIHALHSDSVSAERLRVPGDDHEKSVSMIVDYLSQHEDVDIVCTLGPPGFRSVDEALHRLNLNDRVRHASFDLAMDQLTAIEDGRLSFTVDSQQYLQGYLGVTCLKLYVSRGVKPEGDIVTGPAMVDLSNLTQAVVGVKAGIR
jgi:simple sugar transport system substrate-binding protein